MTATDPATCFHGDQPPCEECERELIHGEYIASLVRRLASFATESLSGASRAASAVTELVSNGVYDTELAETAAGADLMAELDDATRHLRNADRIIKQRLDLLKEA